MNINIIIKKLIVVFLFFGFSCNVFADVVENNILKLKALNYCIGCDLAKGNFQDALLNGTDLTGSNLEGANFNGTDLGVANFTGANLTNVSFINARLAGTNFTDADLTGADLTDTTLKGAIFKRAIFCNTKTPWGIDVSGC